MTILQREDAKEGAFYIEENGQSVAELTYTIEKGKMVIQHTEVDESLRGKNVGYELVERAVELARESHLKIVPVCRFAKKVLQKHASFQDVL